MTVPFWTKLPNILIIIDPEALAKQGDNALGSVCPLVRLCVCLSALSRLKCLTFDLDFWCAAD